MFQKKNSISTKTVLHFKMEEYQYRQRTTTKNESKKVWVRTILLLLYIVKYYYTFKEKIKSMKFGVKVYEEGNEGTY